MEIQPCASLNKTTACTQDPEMMNFFSSTVNVWELVDKPFGMMIMKALKWLWKNKKDEDQDCIRNKARLVVRLCSRRVSLIMPDCLDTQKKQLWRNTVLGDKLVCWMLRNNTALPMSSQRQSIVALSENCNTIADMVYGSPSEDRFMLSCQKDGMRCLTPA
ncbi:hypothetical protein Tco_0982876 [Tanacetum coccineum]